jgi:hypothetical protein
MLPPAFPNALLLSVGRTVIWMQIQDDAHRLGLEPLHEQFLQDASERVERLRVTACSKREIVGRTLATNHPGFNSSYTEKGVASTAGEEYSGRIKSDTTTCTQGG